MKKLLFALGMFVATFLLLSIELKGKPLFSHLHEFALPATRGFQRGAEKLVGGGLGRTRDVGEQLFNNTIPKSAVKLPEMIKAPEENIPEAQKKELDSLIKDYSRR